ncbi:helix-turn-helix domain-containing protein [Streptomyces spirodelae]|uniref:Helix-turn-helix domain-containing protein n=1 Tax=Streptomyces spirodelae TaxID=2812904 RepID=A0ABS3WQ12_9ACTN|nr:helix-turn-helix transcriptional regulator [Streptomyces spirodelae]MBO8184957.1 helix-turn-helix domain-containing protein [Streptomyces spirodelae]
MTSPEGQEPNAGTAPGEPEPGPEISEGLKIYGAVLKALRLEADLTQEEFGPHVRYSSHYIAKIEQGKRFPPEKLPQRAEVVLGPLAGKVLRAAAKSLRRKPGLASWFQQWAGIEEEAITLCAYECRAIPGLLQPEPYIRAVLERQLPPYTEEEIDRLVAARLARQQLFRDRPHTAFSFIVEQSLLERGIGGDSVTKHLIDHLLEVGRLTNVEIQVMPLRQEDHAGSNGQLYLAETEEHRWFGYTEGHQSSNLIATAGDVSVLLQRYGKLRSQALDCRATVSLLEQLRGAL